MKKIEEMHRRFGRRGHGKCKDCKHFKRGRYHNMMLQKCEIYGMTHSEATDWAQKWEACNLFDQEYNGPEIVSLWRERPKEEGPIEGQMDLFGEET